MVTAWVFEIDKEERHVQRGLYQFVELPRQGDRVTLRNGRGATDVMGVVDVEHAPAPVGQPAGQGSNVPPAQEPLASVFVQWLAETGGR